MLNIWSFLLQTLTISGIAALILCIKALFKDKLTPKWQFSVWGILAAFILLPAGIFGTYTLIRWQTLVEIIKSYFGDYSFTRVLFPIPLVLSAPQSFMDWVFVLYTVGVAASLGIYLLSYLRLKRVLRLNRAPSKEMLTRIEAIAASKGIKLHRTVSIEGLPSAFVFGIFHPTLILSEDEDIDDKMITHELFHLKNRDTLWSVVICILRSLHWCNPLIIYCANRALNDMESRCDQYVLETLEGEERREYGKLLLSMTNERFSKTPGSTSINNGGKNVRLRIENIARFKKYPSGMKLASVCTLILLAFSLLDGTKTASFRKFSNDVRATAAAARSTPCTTYAGAFDAYGKAILDRNGYYRAMCAPENIQKDLEAEMLQNNQSGKSPAWNSGLEEWANKQEGYHIYNLTEVEKNVYEGLLVVELNYPPNGKQAEFNVKYLAVQNLRVQKENGRWVTIPLEDFQYIESRFASDIAWGCYDLPGVIYTGTVGDFRIELKLQTVHTLCGTETNTDELSFLSTIHYDTTPNPNGKFNFATWDRSAYCIYLGDESEKAKITHIGVAYSPGYEGKKRPVNPTIPSDKLGSGGSNTGAGWSSSAFKFNENSVIDLNGGGSGVDPDKEVNFPQYYAVDLYINYEKVAEVDLYPTKGGALDE